jgi:ATP-binding cassette, subfamily B, bacterial
MIPGPGPLITVRGMAGPDEESETVPQQVRPGTVRRVLPYAVPYRWRVLALLGVTAIDAMVVVATPLLFRVLINQGIIPRDDGVVAGVALAVGGLALLQALVGFVESRASASISEGLIYDLRTQVFRHVQRQPLGFFTRAQTGSLVSRLNTDVVAAQQAVTSLLSTVVSSALVLLLVFATIFYLSWIVGVIAIAVLPLFMLPGRVVGRRLQRLLRESMQLDAELGSLMDERFNVAGALLVKLYGNPDAETGAFTSRAGRVRDVGVVTAVYARMLLVSVTLVASLATAVVYGVGGGLVVSGAFQIGTLVALATLLARLFGPINQLSNVQSNVMTALVSFDRLFEVLDLKPLITERPTAIALPGTWPDAAPEIEFENVSFRYPAAQDVSLASLETFTLPAPQRKADAWALRDVSFRVEPGTVTALVGPSGAGKTTISYLVPRLYDPVEGRVRIGGHDLRDLTLASIRDTVGMVTQDAHLFHDTLRANLLYARPDATEHELADACAAAQIWELIKSLPDGLDTVVGDRGYRFSGGEKQRIAIARLLLKAPSVVVLDEATAHLDSESEAAVQQAFRTALAGRTSLVIAHRLSTVREADQILVVDAGRIVERGHHDELIAAGGVYAELYRTQFSHPEPALRSPGEGEEQQGGLGELIPQLAPAGPAGGGRRPGGPRHLLPPRPGPMRAPAGASAPRFRPSDQP